MKKDVKSDDCRCFATDGTLLLIGGDNGLFRIWDIKSGTQVKQIKSPEPVTSIAVSKNGDKVITGGAGTIRLYTSKNSL